jgi:hypothetical protein
MNTKVRYIALFDILGFQAIVNNRHINTVVECFRELSSLADCINKTIDFVSFRRFEIKIFSDTIFVFTSEINDECFGDFTKYCSLLVAIAFKKGLMLRGALVKGQTYIDNEVILGQPIVRAYQMEKSQEWVGCWVEDSCVNDLSPETRNIAINNNKIFRYEIPLKYGTVTNSWTIDWSFWMRELINKFQDLDFLRNHFNKLTKEKSIDWSVNRKIINTKQFLKYSLERSITLSKY